MADFPHSPFPRFSHSRSWLRWAIALLALILAAVGAFLSARDLPPVGAGAVVFEDEAVLPVFVPWFADGREWVAAQDLAAYLEELSGRQLRVRREPLFRREQGIYVGDTRFARRELGSEVPEPPLPPERWDNFDYAARDNRIILRGTDPGATELAVGWFLQKQAGVRWWAPTELGEDLPELERLEVAPAQEVVAPGFVSRGVAPISWSDPDSAVAVWGRRNLLRHRLNLSHNLHNIIPPPSEETRHLYPPPLRDHLPMEAHPNLESGEVVEMAAAAAQKFFNRRPEQHSFSVALADHMEFMDWSTYESVDPEKTFRGALDLSPLVFNFTDAVAREVAETHPGRYISNLAYILSENAPDFQLSPNVIPTTTADRSQWYDEAFRQEDLDLMRRWEATGVDILATWDYAFGYQYLIPRIYLEQQAQSVKELREAGVDAFYIEIYPLWGFDAPKTWLYAQLLWDPQADPQALLEEFFTGYYGAAAGPMRQFFDLAEAAWMTQPGPALWIKYFRDEHQALLFPRELIQRMNRTLYEAAVSADSDKVAARVALTIEAMRPLLSLVNYLPTRFALSRATDTAAVVATAPEYLDARQQLKDSITAMLETKSLNRWPKAQPYLLRADPLPGRMALAALAAIFDGGAVPASLKKALETAGRDDVLELLARLQSSGQSRSTNLLANSRFSNELEGWNVYHWPATQIQISPNPGGPELRVTNAKYLNIFQSRNVVEGAAYVAQLPLKGSIPQWGAVHLQMEFFDDEGNILKTLIDRAPPMDNESIILSTAAIAPEGARWVRYFIHLRDQQPNQPLTIQRPVLHAY